MKVVVVGNCTLDHFFRVSRFPKAGETLLSTARMVDVGGKGANQSVVIARCGVAILFVSSLGRDADGDTIRTCLAAESIKLDHLLTSSEPTDQSIIYVTPDGENCIVSSHSAAASITPADAEPTLCKVEAGDIVLLQGNLSLEVTRYCLDEAKRRQARTVLNPAPIQYPYVTLWPLIDCAILNEVEIQELGGGRGPLASGRALLGKGTVFIIVTLGEQGAILISDREPVHIPAPRVVAIDTAGAGDVFCGVFAGGLVRGLSPEDAACCAVQAASLSVTRHGTQSSFPTVEELQDIFNSTERDRSGKRGTAWIRSIERATTGSGESST